MAKLGKTSALFLIPFVLMNGCNGCTKTNMHSQAQADDKEVAAARSDDEAGVKKNDAKDFSLTAEKIFAHASHFHYRSDMTMSTKKGDDGEDDVENIEIIGAKPRVLLKKKIDSLHFIEIIADNDSFYVRNDGKEFRRGADNIPLYRDLIEDGLNLLHVVLNDFALHDRLAEKESDSRKTFMITPGPLSNDAPFIKTFLSKTPSVKAITSSDASGNFVVENKTGLIKNGNLSVRLADSEGRVITLAGNFNLEMSNTGENIALPKLRDDEPQNYPVNVGQRFNDMMNQKESK